MEKTHLMCSCLDQVVGPCQITILEYSQLSELHLPNHNVLQAALRSPSTQQSPFINQLLTAMVVICLLIRSVREKHKNWDHLSFVLKDGQGAIR